MSLDATRWAWQQAGIKATEKLVLLSLADRADELHSCYPSIARLASDTCMDRKTIMAAVNSLEAAGLISVCRGLGSGNRYQLLGVVGRHSTGTKTGTGYDTNSSTKNGTASAGETSTKNGTSPEIGTGTKNGTPPVPKTGLLPVPKTGHESTNESTKNLASGFSCANGSESTDEGRPDFLVNKNPKPKPAKKLTRLPQDFTLTNHRKDAALKYWHGKGRQDLCPETEFDGFIAYHQSEGTTKADWDATWKTWYLRAVKFNRKPFSPPEQTRSRRAL